MESMVTDSNSIDVSKIVVHGDNADGNDRSEKLCENQKSQVNKQSKKSRSSRKDDKEINDANINHINEDLDMSDWVVDYTLRKEVSMECEE